MKKKFGPWVPFVNAFCPTGPGGGLDNSCGGGGGGEGGKLSVGSKAYIDDPEGAHGMDVRIEGPGKPGFTKVSVGHDNSPANAIRASLEVKTSTLSPTKPTTKASVPKPVKLSKAEKKKKDAEYWEKLIPKGSILRGGK